MELVLVVFVLLALATPVLTIFLLWRQHKLQVQLLKLKESSIERNDALHRELLELRREVAASRRATESAVPSHGTLSHGAAPAEESAWRSSPVVPSWAETPAASPIHPVEPAPKPVPTAPPAVEGPQFTDKGLQPAFCGWCGTVHAGGVSNCPTPEAAGRPSEVQKFISWAGSPEKQKEERVPAVREAIPGEPAVPGCKPTRR